MLLLHCLHYIKRINIVFNATKKVDTLSNRNIFSLIRQLILDFQTATTNVSVYYLTDSGSRKLRNYKQHGEAGQ